MDDIKVACRSLILFFTCISIGSAIAKTTTLQAMLLCLSSNDACDASARERAKSFIRDPANDVAHFRTTGVGEPQTALQFVIAGISDQRSLDRNLKVVDQLLARDCDINEIGQYGLTVLHDAVLRSDESLTRALLDRGADPKKAAGKGQFVGKNAIQFATDLQRKNFQAGRSKILKRMRSKSGVAEAAAQSGS